MVIERLFKLSSMVKTGLTSTGRSPNTNCRSTRHHHYLHFHVPIEDTFSSSITCTRSTISHFAYFRYAHMALDMRNILSATYNLESSEADYVETESPCELYETMSDGLAELLGKSLSTGQLILS